MAGDAIANKGDLKDQVKDFMADDFDDAELNRAISFCEAEIRRKLRILDMEVTTQLPILSETLTVPSRFLAARRLHISGSKPMGFITPEECINQQVSKGKGRPVSYTLEGREDGLPFFRFAPIPDTTEHVLNLLFLADMALIDDDDCNQILQKQGDIYFYGTVYHMFAYARNIERMPDVKRIYEEAIANTQSQDIRDKIDGSQLRARASQVPA